MNKDFDGQRGMAGTEKNFCLIGFVKMYEKAVEKYFLSMGAL